MITDKLLQALGLDESFYGYIKQFPNEQPTEGEDPPSDPHFRTTPAHNFITETTIKRAMSSPFLLPK